MVRYFMELSNYIMIICIALYTYECFAVFRYANLNDRNGIYIRQNLLMVLMHLTGIVTLFLQYQDNTYLFFGAFQLIILFAFLVLMRFIYPNSNHLTINNMCLLLSVGFLILMRLSLPKAVGQFKIVIAALVLGIVIPFLINKFSLLKRFTWIYAAVGVFALGLVLIIGSVTNGSKITFHLLGFTFQPAEFVKIIFVFFVAGMLYKSVRLLQVALTSLVAGAHVLILVLSKDLGSALIFFVVYVCMLYVATKKWIYLLLGAGVGTTAAVFAYQVFSHVRVRVEAWQNPWDDLAGTGYQITQSLFAIGTGSFFGLGLGKGTPEAIPYVETDFVFSAIGEEMGILFALCLLLICVSCFIMFMNIAMRLQDNFYRLIAVGLGITYIFQVFLTIGGGTKFIPLTGVTLPFISYGGSSILATVMMFSVMQGLYLIRQDERKGVEDAEE